MDILLSNNFKKKYKKLDKKIQLKFIERIDVLKQSPNSPVLNRHKLSGEFQGLESINISGDHRAIFYETENCLNFLNIGTHSQLYG